MSDLARVRREAVVRGEVEERLLEDRLPVWPVPRDDRGGHVVQDHHEGAAIEVLERQGQPFEQGDLPLVGEEVQEELARRAEQAAQRMDEHHATADRHLVG